MPNYRKYHFYPDTGNMDEAHNFCENKGQKLPTFYSEEDWTTFQTDISKSSNFNNPNEIPEFYLGAKFYNNAEEDEKQVDGINPPSIIDNESSSNETLNERDHFYWLHTNGTVDVRHPLKDTIDQWSENDEHEHGEEGDQEEDSSECLLYNHDDKKWSDHTCSDDYKIACVNRKQYFFFPDVRLSWDGAVDFCRDRGMQLPTFRTEAEYELFLEAKYQTNRAYYWPSWWIGMRYSSTKYRNKRSHWRRYMRYDANQNWHYVDEEGNYNFPVVGVYENWYSTWQYAYYPHRYSYYCANTYGYKGYGSASDRNSWYNRIFSTRCYYSRNVVCEKNEI